MLTGIVLVIIAVLFRFASPVFGWWNFVPMGAVALYAGSRLPRRWAWMVPVAAMILSDLVLDHSKTTTWVEGWRLMSYATFGATALLGPLARIRKFGPWLLPVLSVAGSTLFFLTSNFAVWAEGLLYPMTLSGLGACYVLGLEFFWKGTLPADFIGTAILFGLGPVVEMYAKRLSHGHGVESAADVPATEPSQAV
jgi:hypothetical protein